MKYLIVIIILIISIKSSSCQITTNFYFPRQENSATTSAKMESAKQMVEKAYQAYNEGNLEKTRYFLDQSERNGYVSASFYYLLGKWCYDKVNYVAAKRYWNRGYNKYGCWECKELVHKVENGEEIK